MIVKKKNKTRKVKIQASRHLNTERHYLISMIRYTNHLLITREICA